MHSESNAPTPTNEQMELDEDDYHRLLASERRRLALNVLASAPLPITLDALATELATLTVDATTVDREQTLLHHYHLPMMDDLGVIEYDWEAKRIEAHCTSIGILLG